MKTVKICSDMGASNEQSYSNSMLNTAACSVASELGFVVTFSTISGGAPPLQ